MVLDNNDDNASAAETSTTGFTPPTSVNDPTMIDDLWDGRISAVPWPGNNYIILEKGTDRAICLDKDQRLHLSDDPNANNHWMIVERQGYFGFHNTKNDKFIGHNNHLIHAAVSKLSDWESFVPRQHPDGSYQLMSPVWSHTMMVVCTSARGDGCGLERRHHGQTRWEFIKV